MIYKGPKPQEISGHDANTTNNKMELQTAIQGLRHLNAPSRVRLYSDSAYLLDAVNKGWLTAWEENGWKKADKKPVKNVDLWRELLEAAETHEVKWLKVRGHSGHPANDRCHELVQQAISQSYRTRL